MERTIEDLIADLKSTDDFTREEAIGELEMKGDEVVDPLIDHRHIERPKQACKT